MTEQFKRAPCAPNESDVTAPWHLVDEFLAHLRQAGLSDAVLRNLPGPAKHFLVWLKANGLEADDVNATHVRQFLDHRCQCARPHGARYLSSHMHSRKFKGGVLRFVQFIQCARCKPSPVSLTHGLERIAAFGAFLREQGYAESTIRGYEYCCRHFVVWLHQQNISLSSIDEAIIEQFAEHDCICPGLFVLCARRDPSYQFKVRRFVRFLITIGVVAGAARTDQPEDVHLREFRDWLRRHRGTGEGRITAYAQTIAKLLPQLGNDASQYDTALINRVILLNLAGGSRTGAQRVCGSLRMYLRFLAATGACRPGLLDALPRIPRWRMAELPRYILSDDVERVIASCDTTTHRGLRDRAIVLLLARLALRAGDVAGLRLCDIDWSNALLRVAGKTRRTVALPLPQDAGDALLAYIEHARPKIDSDKVFVRAIAPFRPFTSSSPISIVVNDALERAGVVNVNLRGAYLLRHSAATHMLRTGATLEAVSAVLRHRSTETTTIYAKVDTAMLSQVVQPWIGGAPCR